VDDYEEMTEDGMLMTRYKFVYKMFDVNGYEKRRRLNNNNNFGISPRVSVVTTM
jgi:hypothetical protein